MMKRLLLSLTATLACVATSGQAQISVGAAGTGILTFDTAPTDANSWATQPMAGDGKTFATIDQVEAAIQALDQSSISTVLPTSATTPPSTSAAGFRYNTALKVIQSRPTTVAGVLLKATLQNNSGGTISSMTISYDFAEQTPAATVGELPAHVAYWSLTGAPNSWTRLNSLSDGSEAAGTRSAEISVGSWDPGAFLYIVWADDNADGITDPSYTIDNFSVTLPGVPPSITTQPVAAAVNEEQTATLSVVAAGSAPLSYQWYKNGAPISGATASTLVVTNTSGSNRPWSVPGDNGNYYVTVTGSANPPVTSATVAVAVTPDTTRPIAEWANLTTNPAEVVLNLSESLDDYTAAVTNLSSYVVESSSGTLNITNVNHTVNSPRVHIFVDQALTVGGQYFVKNTLALPDRAQTPNFLSANTRLPVLSASNHIADLNHVWKYNEADLDLPANWTAVAFDDSGADWKSGAGPFDAKLHGNGATGENCRDTIPFYPTNGVGLGPVGTCISYISPVSQTNLITTYFRTHFTSPASGGSNALLHLQGKIDDGAVIYLNGTEIARVRLPAAPTAITRGTFAPTNVGDGDAQDNLEYYVPGLVAGDNVLAIEVHQNSLTSSDKTLGLIISLLAGGAPSGPRLSITQSGTTGHVTWSGSGTLQFKSSLSDANWTPIAGPYPQNNGQNDVSVNFTTNPARFYRVVE